MNRILLGVNIDHVATLRQARHTRYPDPVEAVYASERGEPMVSLFICEKIDAIFKNVMWNLSNKFYGRA